MSNSPRVYLLRMWPVLLAGAGFVIGGGVTIILHLWLETAFMMVAGFGLLTSVFAGALERRGMQ